MLHGKKGFDRIVWAFKNVLNQTLAWLFCDLESRPEDHGWLYCLLGLFGKTDVNTKPKIPSRSRSRVHK